MRSRSIFSQGLSWLVSFSIFLSSIPSWAQQGETSLPLWLTTTGQIRETLEYLLRDQYEIDRNQESLVQCLDAHPQTDKEAAVCRDIGQRLSQALLSSASWIKDIVRLSQSPSAQPLAPSLVEKISALSKDAQNATALAERLESEARIFLADVDAHGNFSCDELSALSEFPLASSHARSSSSTAMKDICRHRSRTGNVRIEDSLAKFAPKLPSVKKFWVVVSGFEPTIVTPGEDREGGHESGNCTGGGCREHDGESGSGSSAEPQTHEGEGPVGAGHEPGSHSRPEPKEYSSEAYQRWAQSGGGESQRPQPLTDEDIKRAETKRFEQDANANIWPVIAKTKAGTDKLRERIESTPKGELYRPANGTSTAPSQQVPDIPSTDVDSRELAKRNRNARIRLISSEPQNEFQSEAKRIGLDATDEADKALAAGDANEADGFVQIAEVAADITLSMIPFVGVGKDIVEMISGRSIVTGEELSDAERWMAALGVITAGGFGMAKAGIKLIGKAEKAEHVAQTLIKAIDKVVVRSAEEVNALWRDRGYLEDTYKAGTKVFEFTTPAKMSGTHVRVFKDAGGQSGRWTMEKAAIEGLSPKEIASKFSLPDVPTHVVDVEIPAGVRMRRGAPARVMEGADGKWSPRQYEFVDTPFKEWFKNPRSLE